MDWIKVKTKHILWDYTDLSDSEFRAWIKIMALTAGLEQMPTYEQMLKEVHYKTIESLQYKFNKRSIDLQYILNKVLIDVQETVNKKEYWKAQKQKQRILKTNVLMDIQEKSNNRLDKIRLDKNNINMRFWKFWDAYPRKKSKGQAEKVFIKINPDEQLLATMIAKIEQAKKSDSWKKENGQFIPYPATWLNAQGWED